MAAALFGGLYDEVAVMEADGLAAPAAERASSVRWLSSRRKPSASWRMAREPAPVRTSSPSERVAPAERASPGMLWRVPLMEATVARGPEGARARSMLSRVIYTPKARTAAAAA